LKKCGVDFAACDGISGSVFAAAAAIESSNGDSIGVGSGGDVPRDSGYEVRQENLLFFLLNLTSILQGELCFFFLLVLVFALTKRLTLVW
jgi:hypothetical protein